MTLRAVAEGEIAAWCAGRKECVGKITVRRSRRKLHEVTVVNNLWCSVFLGLQRDLRSLRCELLSLVAYGRFIPPSRVKKA